MESRLAPSFLPPVGVLEMTYNCNHGCRFCSCPWEDPRPHRRLPRQEEMSVQEWMGCIQRVCDMGVTSLAFTGGEPLLKEGLEDLLRFAASRTVEHVETVDGRLTIRVAPPRVHLLTNGTALTWAHLDLCRDLGLHLSMSLPGIRTFSWHTGGADPSVILERFQQARDRGIPTTVAVTVTQHNLPELYETLAAGLLAGADAVLLNRVLPGGRSLRWFPDLALSPSEVRQALDVAEEVLATADRRGSVGTELPRCILGDGAWPHLQVGTRCSAATGFFVVGPSGYVRVCNHSPVNLVHWRDLDALRLDPYWMRFLLKRWLPRECRACPSMGTCDGGCREAAHVLLGDLEAPDHGLGPLS